VLENNGEVTHGWSKDYIDGCNDDDRRAIRIWMTAGSGSYEGIRRECPLYLGEGTY
jgi:hypothetical protein